MSPHIHIDCALQCCASTPPSAGRVVSTGVVASRHSRVRVGSSNSASIQYQPVEEGIIFFSSSGVLF
eukprot:scaffold260378_cov28-Tisochrysis_lutea.AAC.1